jgi:hypothetical protein
VPIVLPPVTLLSFNPESGGALTLTPYAARGVTQTLEPIATVTGQGTAAGTMIRRDINGNLVNLFPVQLRKYQSTVTCRDVETPALDDAWIGQTISVACTAELNYLTVGGTPQRPEVSGSSYVEGNFTFYRPLLTMMVMSIKSSFAEYPATYSWEVVLQEV